jgi:hypothetical protein
LGFLFISVFRSQTLARSVKVINRQAIGRSHGKKPDCFDEH